MGINDHCWPANASLPLENGRVVESFWRAPYISGYFKTDLFKELRIQQKIMLQSHYLYQLETPTRTLVWLVIQRHLITVNIFI